MINMTQLNATVSPFNKVSSPSKTLIEIQSLEEPLRLISIFYKKKKSILHGRKICIKSLRLPPFTVSMGKDKCRSAMPPTV